MQSESDYIQEFKKRLLELKPIKLKINNEETHSLQSEIYVESSDESKDK